MFFTCGKKINTGQYRFSQMFRKSGRKKNHPVQSSYFLNAGEFLKENFVPFFPLSLALSFPPLINKAWPLVNMQPEPNEPCRLL